MKQYLRVAVAVILTFFTGLQLESVQAQTRKCGSEILNQHLSDIFPDAKAMLQHTMEENVALAQSYKPNLKTTANTGIVPVIFHIVLNDAQIAKLGGSAGIARRVDSQIAVINRDFNRENADSTKIPNAFKPLYGNAGIRFALARRMPDGRATPGYEILTTTESGYEESSSMGSGMGFTGAKFLNGNTTAWNPDVYLNVWVVNPMDNGKSSSILGLCMPPSFLKYGIPGMTKNELGVVINWGAFGVRTSLLDYYISGITGGRTLTHELGHYFELRHIWGDDDGKCVGNGGQDDGISDTPPQADASYGCLTYPYFDACATSGNGIMFMNFMDYVNDVCMQMFTNGQTAVMQTMVTQGQASYPLTQNPEVLQWPTAVSDVAANADLTIYPNPASSTIYLSGADALTGVNIYDMAGRQVMNIAIDKTASQHSINISSLTKGMYLVHCTTATGTTVKKLVVQ
jgi:hypothetical protein